MHILSPAAPIDQMRFRLFEIGIYLTEPHVEFLLAKANQAMQAITQQRHQRKTYLGHSALQTKKIISHESNSSLNHALSMAYRAYTPTKRWIPETSFIFHIEAEQMACPTPMQSHYHSQHFDFDAREELSYCSQFDAKVALMWCAIDKALIDIKYEDYLEKMTQSFPKELMQWHTALHYKTRQAKNYLPIIVHPWQYKHQVLYHLREAHHEKQFIGPLFQQTMYPTFDPCTLVSKNPSQAIIQMNLTHQTFSNQRLERSFKKILKHTNHFNQTLYCLFEKTSINLTHSTAPLPMRILHSPNDYLTDKEWTVPLNSLINTNHHYTRPLLIEMFDGKSNDPFLLLKSFIKTFYHSHIALLKTHGLRIDSAPEHLLVVLKKGAVTKIIYREPKLFKANSDQQKNSDSLLKTISLFRACYEKHMSGNDVHEVCQQALQRYQKNTRW